MKNITGHTRLTGLLGSPVAHSLSPLMHNEAFRHLGLDYIYLAFDVKAESMETAINGLRELNVRGFNITMPCKNIMAKLCDNLSPAARITGSVNTVVNDNGVFTGYTTDGIGYMKSLQSAGYNIIGKKMTLLGAGGAATAILVQAALDGVSEISVFNRKGPSYEGMLQTLSLLKESTSCKVTLYDLDDETALKREISDSAILTNGTSVGMSPNTEQSIITDSSYLHKDLIVSDIIYNPRETKLLKLAKEQDCKTCNGLYMLLYQGAEAFKLWTGQDMPVSIIKEKFFSE